MELLLIELVLWGGFFLLLWALKDGLGRVEADLEALGLSNRTPLRVGGTIPHYSRAERLIERIGTYCDQPIYAYAEIGGRTYRFDRVCPEGTIPMLRDNERCLPPGLVYVRCSTSQRVR